MCIEDISSRTVHVNHMDCFYKNLSLKDIINHPYIINLNTERISEEENFSLCYSFGFFHDIYILAHSLHVRQLVNVVYRGCTLQLNSACTCLRFTWDVNKGPSSPSK